MIANLVLALVLTGIPAGAEEPADTIVRIDAMQEEIEKGGYSFDVDAEALAAGSRDNLNGFIPPPAEVIERHLERGRIRTAEGVAAQLPPRWNWMDYEGVTPIKNQRPAGTCWAFATVAPLECNIRIHDGVEEDLSEQYLVSCNNDGLGCNTGGWAVHQYFSVIPPGEAACDGLSGAVLEADFSYTCGEGSYTPDCAGTLGDPLPRPYQIDNFAYLTETVAAIKEAIFNYGPVSVSVAVDPYFSAYAGGVFDRNYSDATNHAVSLVGWDDTQGESGIWYLRNSWGTDWGEAGYMRIEYGCSAVGSYPSYVVYKGGVVNSAGITALDRAGYAGGNTIGLILRDMDLAGTGSVDLELVSDSGDTETVTLMEATEAGNFFADMNSAEGAVVTEDGTLQTTLADTIRLQYIDADDGRGGQNVLKEATAWADGTAPLFTGLEAVSAGHGYVSLTWQAATDDHPPLTYRIWRRSEGGDWIHIATVSDLAYHDYTAEPGQDYDYRAQALDVVGNADENLVFLTGQALEAWDLGVGAISPEGLPADDACRNIALSGDGRIVAFESAATNLVAAATNNRRDIFVTDMQTGLVELASRAPDGSEGNGHSYTPVLSADGRYLAFSSYATNLVAGDTNGRKDVFLLDRQTGTMTLISRPASGQSNGNSDTPDISADGRYIAFVSFATNLVAGDTNGKADIFVYDRMDTSLTLDSCAADGTPGDGAAGDPSISADGSYVAFESTAANLVAGDTNRARDIFRKDRQSGEVLRVSTATGGSEGDGNSGDPSINGDGNLIVFHSLATNLISGDFNAKGDIFAHDIPSGETELISKTEAGAQGLQHSEHPEVSADGRWVVYDSTSANLVSGDANSERDVFRFDRTDGSVERLSLGPQGLEGDGSSSRAHFSADGRYAGFQSDAANLVSGDTNEVTDVFLLGPLWSSNPSVEAVPAVSWAVLMVGSGLIGLMGLRRRSKG
jgi:Tol biopolymer transport system component